MALDYTELFTHLGKLVKFYNQYKADANSLDAVRDEILDAFQVADQDIAINGLVAAFERWKVGYIVRRSELASFAHARLLDKDSVLDEIGASSIDLNEILRKLLERMTEDGKTVDASTASVPQSATADGDNTGGGAIFVTDILDGVTSPGSINDIRFPAMVKYNVLKTELVVPQKFVFAVIGDSFQDDLDEGSEEISWEGLLADEPNGIGEEGCGPIATFQAIHATTSDVISNADFEEFTGDAPDDWDIIDGTEGTNIYAGGASHAAHGTNALVFEGNAVWTNISIQQSVSPGSIMARKRYCVTAKLKRDSSAMSGNFRIQFKGTGYSVGTELLEITDVTQIGTDYQLHHFFVTMPALIPGDFRLVISWGDETLGSGEKIYIDDLGFGPVIYGGGIGVIAVRDSGPFVRDDRYQLNVQNDDAGAFQAFFRRAFGVQLPSETNGNIDDDLAQ